MRIELAQDDDPYIKSSVQPGALTLTGASLSIPIREPSATVAGAAAPRARATVKAPRLASDQGTRSRFRIRVRRSRATPAGAVDHFEVEVRDTRSAKVRRLTSRLRGSLVRFTGRRGRTYRFRARAVDRTGLAGAWVPARTIVPIDDGKALHYRGKWKRPRGRRAFGGRLSYTSRRGRAVSLRVRGTRILIVGRKSRRGGKARVTVNGRRRTISFYGRRTRNRVVVATVRGRAKGVNRVKITVLGRKGSKRGRAGAWRSTRSARWRPDYSVITVSSLL